MSKKILIISDAAPFDGQRIRESLDMALIFAAIDQDVSWLFTGASVLALTQGANPNSIGIKDFFKQLKTLEIYDVDSLFACEHALLEYKLSTEQLNVDVDPLSYQQQQRLISEHDHVVKL
ncbi:tRNA 2-thiouridine(34) synthase TusC [Pseudoalteromonas luteoviolacea]|uniref:tRNA 2-thiouridine(34) synthase TusC n=1 Tax=Pseudoalteromonas luteoviolacea TaxID=43657 RepID=A0A1C0TUH0_9GAMM|nr:sulfurtransferase complex subunit TusC [Pseudoalteromonas luteoviolacea]MBQ4812953.1 sulfurtransferase complex subunit TusC [Pseudoalteromonas luteoviolacea]OCQ22966.1 tRNA 2-thiouridine(34) synthase TusC [Pseudoalteromonas luteoviolacea]